MGRQPVWSPRWRHHVPGLLPGCDASTRGHNSGRGVRLPQLASPYPLVVRQLFLVVCLTWVAVGSTREAPSRSFYDPIAYESPVPQRRSSAPIHLDHNLFMGPHLHDHSCLVPYVWVLTCLVLNGQWGSDGKRLKASCVPCQLNTINFYGIGHHPLL